MGVSLGFPPVYNFEEYVSHWGYKRCSVKVNKNSQSRLAKEKCTRQGEYIILEILKCDLVEVRCE